VGFDKIYNKSRSRAAAAAGGGQDVVIGMQSGARRYPAKDVIELEHYLVSLRHRQPPAFFASRLRFAGPRQSLRRVGRLLAPPGYVMMKLSLNDARSSSLPR